MCTYTYTYTQRMLLLLSLAENLAWMNSGYGSSPELIVLALGPKWQLPCKATLRGGALRSGRPLLEIVPPLLMHTSASTLHVIVAAGEPRAPRPNRVRLHLFQPAWLIR